MRIATSLVALLATGVLATNALAQEGPISQSFTQTVRIENVAKFEAAFKQHIDWHRQQNDAWTWNMWSSMSGDLGRYIVISGGHTWADFDSPSVDPQADEADAMATLGQYVETVTVGYARLMPELSNPAADPVPLVRVFDYNVNPGKQGDFFQVISKIGEAAKQANWGTNWLWLDLEGSAGGPDYVLVIQHPNWASLEPPEVNIPTLLEQTYGRQEAQALLNMLSAAAEQTSDRIWMRRPDLSYVPGN